jgi:aminopeptidase N
MSAPEPRAVHLKDYRAPDYKVAEIALDFALDPQATRIAATTKMTRTGAVAPLRLDGERLKLVSIAIDGRPLAETEYALDDESLTIHAPPEKFELKIVTEIAPAKNTELQGLYRAKGLYCTQNEAEGFRRITYYLDRPDVLAVYTTRIEAPKAACPVLLSNGNPIESGDLPGGRHFAVWHDPFPKPCYLFALVAGDLGRIEDDFVTSSGRTVALRIFVERGNEEKARWAMASLKNAMKWDERIYGREYDLDIFMIVAVSAFNFGAMENKGLNIFNDAVLLASPDTATDDNYAHIESVVAHEYFHNWTGDRITCRDWFQLSLKEGLTVFRDQNFSADMRSAPVQRIEDVRALRLRQFQEDAGPLAHPVQPQSYITIDNFYTATVYEKGAEVIGMLKTLVGPEGYRKATDLYFARHDGTAATVEDWVKCFEDVSGRDLAQFRLWYAQAGTPVVEATGAYDPQKKTYALTVKQSLRPTPGQPVKLPMLIPLRLGLVGAATGRALPLTLEGENAAGPAERVLELTEAEKTFVFTGVEEAPLLSLGRGFSAPVVFKHPQSVSERARLMAFDPDPFNRWEAGQAAARVAMFDMMAGKPADKAHVAAIGEVLKRAGEDMAFAAHMLSLPLESEMAMAMETVDPDAIHGARVGLIRAAAAAHRSGFAALYGSLKETAPYAPDAASCGRRALKNAALRYLTAADDEAAAKLAETHYREAANMTDMIAGLAALSRMTSKRAGAAFAHFYERFKSEPLVLDKWMGLQAGSPRPDTVERVRVLMAHPAFDIKNPNRVRALVGAFAFNQLRFHGSDGSGYALVGETIRRLDPINAMVAARMAGAFETWRRFDLRRQGLMRTELERMIALPGVSSNLYEVVSKMLG